MLTDVEHQVIALYDRLIDLYGEKRVLRHTVYVINEAYADSAITSDEKALLHSYLIMRYYMRYKDARIKIVTKDNTRLYVNQIYAAYKAQKITYDEKVILETYKSLERYFYNRGY